MSSNDSNGRYRDRVARDADDIAGFFQTRAGTITALALGAAVIIGIIVSAITGWFS